ncbi:hypothetical protein RHMOL_Rhmol10G0293900 [Rhododendron molle]|uniref:Uncharacterized protein n=1 Tax=Rhododendron molle TaxID=49168 RepID=A0ACC0M8I6_RHOML|nr:hypothetical protein RHMOL_Rhmol10G0293900 [Rhododendron molle]
MYLSKRLKGQSVELGLRVKAPSGSVIRPMSLILESLVECLQLQNIILLRDPDSQKCEGFGCVSEIERAHLNCFPKVGEIRAHVLMTKQKRDKENSTPELCTSIGFWKGPSFKETEEGYGEWYHEDLEFDLDVSVG